MGEQPLTFGPCFHRASSALIPRLGRIPGADGVCADAHWIEARYQDAANLRFVRPKHFTVPITPQSAGSRTRFVIDLPDNQLGPGWRRLA
jgi:hypothetical protein